MAKLTEEITHEFEGQKFKNVPVKSSKFDGINQNFRIYLEENGNTLVAINQNNDVVLKIIGDGLTVVEVDGQ